MITVNALILLRSRSSKILTKERRTGLRSRAHSRESLATARKTSHEGFTGLLYPDILSKANLLGEESEEVSQVDGNACYKECIWFALTRDPYKTGLL